MRVMNAVEGYTDHNGQFHPIRGSADYEPGRLSPRASAGTGRRKKAKKARVKKAKKPAKKAKKRKVASKRAASKRVASALRASKLYRKAKAATSRPAKKKNPMPLGKFVTAKVRRRPGGKLDVLIERKKR